MAWFSFKHPRHLWRIRQVCALSSWLTIWGCLPRQKLIQSKFFRSIDIKIDVTCTTIVGGKMRTVGEANYSIFLDRLLGWPYSKGFEVWIPVLCHKLIYTHIHSKKIKIEAMVAWFYDKVSMNSNVGEEFGWIQIVKVSPRPCASDLSKSGIRHSLTYQAIYMPHISSSTPLRLPAHWLDQFWHSMPLSHGDPRWTCNQNTLLPPVPITPSRIWNVLPEGGKACEPNG
jgi:hypothetical protein